MDEANRSLKKVIIDYKDYIETTTKGPVLERSKVTNFGSIIVKEDQKVSTVGPLYSGHSWGTTLWPLYRGGCSSGVWLLWKSM